MGFRLILMDSRPNPMGFCPISTGHSNYFKAKPVFVGNGVPSNSDGLRNLWTVYRLGAIAKAIVI